MKIIMTGGGSGGHITPILAVAAEVKKLQPDAQIIYVGQRGDLLHDIPAQDPNIDAVELISAGKLRRYHGEGIKQLFDVQTVALNIRDVFRTLAGLWQSYRLLKRLRPEVIFVKGGFVGVPVGLAAALLHIPFVTHDSDALPGLANRIIARWARVHAVALPKNVYHYPPEKTITVGVPIASGFTPYDEEKRHAAKQKLQIEPDQKVLLVTGGGLGAQRINQSLAVCLPELLARYPDLFVMHFTGRHHVEQQIQQYDQSLAPALRPRVRVEGFVTNFYEYSGVADVIVTRAGGSAMAEFAAQAKACVVVPNPVLTGGHQLVNARAFSERKAAWVVSNDDLAQDPRKLLEPIMALLDDPKKAKTYGERLASLAKPDAARRLAVVLLEQAT